MIAELWNLRYVLKSWAISQIRRWKGNPNCDSVKSYYIDWRTQIQYKPNNLSIDSFSWIGLSWENRKPALSQVTWLQYYWASSKSSYWLSLLHILTTNDPFCVFFCFIYPLPTKPCPLHTFFQPANKQLLPPLPLFVSHDPQCSNI